MSAGVDPRGPRFSAWVTGAVLLVALAPRLQAPRLQTPRLQPTRLQRTDEREDETPLRFAQAVGFAFAAFGFCLGCQMYLLITRLSNKEVGTAR
jgi:hypothetical protein